MTYFIGYAAIFAYAGVLIFGIGTIVNKKTGLEISRKVIHTMLFLVWVLIDIFFKGTIHQIILPFVFFVLNMLSYKLSFFKNIECGDDNHPGTVYFAMAITIALTVAYFFPETYYCSGVASFCLCFGDGAAAAIGHAIKSKRLRKHKSLSGFLACIGAALASLCAFYPIYIREMPILSIIAIAVVTAILELFENGLDNVSIVAGTFLLSLLFMAYPMVWFSIAVLVAEAVFLILFIKKLFSYRGALLVMIAIITAGLIVCIAMGV